MLDRRPSCGIVLKTQMQILNATKLWLEYYIKAGLPESKEQEHTKIEFDIEYDGGGVVINSIIII